ncbi:FGGY-family carbohydrate kinase [Pseudaminobacter sp. 19-2017]|uniref:FGGY-family carbohydrate kinase n=1 Tax=Pseudaminobacter soli (ex Zhang et al. 2022) TaxID=2831468 RepID=A0A942E0Y9_9HYPH|nr:FGGY-family carbohydrate kinase [Pseudaminobacter soli]MBS3649001.1 FGGY-family carbohydrate kinase [Pseudaminobacter soli]
MTARSTPRRVAVIDIGKSSAKIAAVDLESMEEQVVARTPNEVISEGPYPHFDTERLWEFIQDGLADLAREGAPDAISVTAHGASGALLGADGSLALRVLDYEFPGPDTLSEEYGAVRPRFSETGSPRLPGGLNLGAQLYWQSRTFPEAFGRTVKILTYPQYWSYRLSGVAANEATSLGTHTDLWSPAKRDFSSLVDRLGWRNLMAPLHSAGERLGPVLPVLARRLGLAEETPVLCGIHDSNASLYPHLVLRAAPFTVVSTGTWVVAMAVGGDTVKLDPARDTLINVNAFGDPAPSARFMGGRTFSLLLGDQAPEPDEADVSRVLSTPVILTPSVVKSSGPYPDREARWLPGEPEGKGQRFAAVSFHLAMMTSICLELAGARGETIVEGPFCANGCFTRMLATATERPVLVSKGGTGTSVGAALLFAAAGQVSLGPQTTISPEPAWADYVARWRAAAV